MVADGAGNVYVTGSIAGTVTFGGVTLTATSSNSIFVAKWRQATGSCVWAQVIGATSLLSARAIAVSGSNIYVTGDFSGVATFGTTTLTCASSSQNIFVCKLTDLGTSASIGWAVRAGGSTSSDVAYGISVQGSAVYVAGRFSSDVASFGSVDLVNPSGRPDSFVAKLADNGSTGNFVWAQRLGGVDNDEAFAVTSVGSNVYVTGYFRGALVGNGAGLATAGFASDVFVAKFVDGGASSSLGWVVQAGGTDADQALAIAATGTGVYVTGYFTSSTATFGLHTITNSGPMSSADLFLAKLTDGGASAAFAWVRQSGGSSDELGSALAVQGTNVFVAGSFGSSQTGSTPASFGPATLSNAGLRDVFVAKLVDVGSPSFGWAQQAGGAGNDAPTAVVVSGTGVDVGGYVVAPASFSSITLTGAPTGPTGFLATLTDPTLTATAAGRALVPAQLFPNPARRTAALRLPVGTAPVPLVLTDAQGRAVRCYPAPFGSEATLDLSGLPAGLYLLRGIGLALRLTVE